MHTISIKSGIDTITTPITASVCMKCLNCSTIPFSLENEIIYITCEKRKIIDKIKLRKNTLEIRLLNIRSITAKITASTMGTKKHCGKPNNTSITAPPKINKHIYIIMPSQWSISCCII